MNLYIITYYNIYICIYDIYLAIYYKQYPLSLIYVYLYVYLHFVLYYIDNTLNIVKIKAKKYI